MEVMEDGNLMDKVQILIQRDMEYYTSKQTILQEVVCRGIAGGRLDFPRAASFAATKLVLWWEEEYVAAYRKSSGFIKSATSCELSAEAAGGCGGIVKASDPVKFVALISKSAEQLLEHLHVLTQEALDHADLTVLTGTIGAAALIKNCLWFYIQSMSGDNKKGNSGESLQTAYKSYQEMGEALAERLLDLHCRLLSLYILQEADSLDWENSKSFCESERGSYVIQMWWLYMQGTKEDLWSTVPPKMAERVFSGMLNESLTILLVRYTQSTPSEARSQLLTVDISNLLLCIAQLLTSICNNAEEYVGLNLNMKSKILRDIHTKCQELLNCLILRGAPLDALQKVFRNGIENVELFKSKTLGPTPWIIFALPHIFKTQTQRNVHCMADFGASVAIALELNVLLAQPEPSWALLLKVLCMRQCTVLNLILGHALRNYKSEMQKSRKVDGACEFFLCTSDGTCRDGDGAGLVMTQMHYYQLINSATNVLITVGNTEDYYDSLFSAIAATPNWEKCFDRLHVWNQIRPPWYEAILNLVQPLLPIITKAVINAVQTGASTYQAMLVILACFSQLWDCVDISLPKITNLIQDLLPASVTPLGHSPLIQILMSALYSELIQTNEKAKKKEVKIEEGAKVDEAAAASCDNRKNSAHSFDSVFKSDDEVGLAVAEALCSIDEDHKHTDQIDEFVEQVRENLEMFGDLSNGGAARVEETEQTAEVMNLYNFIQNNQEWLFQELGVSDKKEKFIPNQIKPPSSTLLHTMFYIGYHQFDQLLIGEWQPNWISLMQTPMGLSVDRVWSQVSLRWEFRDTNSSSLLPKDVQVVNSLSTLLKQN